MARKRMISPEFFTSRTLNDLPIQTMVTFAGLWCHADDQGRAEDDVVMIKAAVWARRRTVSESKIEVDLKLLDERLAICRYEVNGYELLHIVNWSEHQKINHPTESKLPPCRHHEEAAWELFMRDTDPRLDRYRRPPVIIPEGSRAIEVNSREENLSDSCIHGFAPNDDCPMCQRKAPE